MGVTGISIIPDFASSQSLGQGQDALAEPVPAPAQTTAAAVPTQDNFTPSSQSNSVQDPGIFQVSQFALSSATADAISSQAATLQPATTPAVAPAPAQNVPTGNINLDATSAVAADPTPAPDAPAPTPAPANVSAPPPAPSYTEGEPQAMNSELLVLGLSNTDIQDIDRLASVTKNFNPIVYNDLIQQFETQSAEQKTPVAQPVSDPTINPQ